MTALKFCLMIPFTEQDNEEMKRYTKGGIWIKKMKVDETAYKTLRKIQLSEEKFPLLTKIEQNFYSKLAEYQKNLDNIPETEIQTIKRIFTIICELREEKIVKAALSKARGGKPDLKNMLDEEKKLFDSVLDVLMQTRIKLFGED